MRSVNLLAITVLSIMLVGCPGAGTGSPASPLAGDWKTPTPDNAQVVLTFDDDGNLVQLTGTTPDGQSQTRSITGAVTVIDGEMITIRIPTDTGEIVLEGTLSSTGNMFIGVLSGEFIVSEDLDIRLAQGEVRIDRETNDDDNDNLNGNDNSDDGNANDNVDDDNLNDNMDVDGDDNLNDNSDDDNVNDNSDDDDDNLNDNSDDDNVNDNSDDDNLNDNVDDDDDSDNLNDNADDDDNLNDNVDDDNLNDNADDDNLNDNTDDTVMGDAANGETLFVANCSGCHAADGSGGVGPNIQGKSVDDILEHAVDGDDGHVMFDLTDAEAQDIEAYLDTF